MSRRIAVVERFSGFFQSSPVPAQPAAEQTQVVLPHGVLAHADISIIAEAPKMSPHLGAMKENISRAIGIGPEEVGIKATTNEAMGFVGREEGIAALAVASIEKI